MRPLIWSLAGLALGGVTAAQAQSVTEVVTVYWMVHSGIIPTDNLEEAYRTVTWTGSVMTAAPEATTYNLILDDRFTADGIETELTLVNGPSTHAAWQIHNFSTTYGEWCSIGPADPSASLSAPIHSADPAHLEYDCTIRQLTTRVRGTGDEQSTETFVETYVNEFPVGDGEVTRTFAAVVAEITEGMEMLEQGEGVNGAGAEETRATGGGTTGAAASETTSETAGDAAAETSGSVGESGVAGRDGVSLMLLGAGLLGAGLIV